MPNYLKTILSFLIKKRKKVIGLCVTCIVIYFLFTKVIPNLSPFGFAVLIVFVLVFLAKWSDNDKPRTNVQSNIPDVSSSIQHTQTNQPPPQRSESSIRDLTGNLRARIVTEGHITRIYNHAGNYLGYYNSETNFTYNHAGNVIAQGNVLATLV